MAAVAGEPVGLDTRRVGRIIEAQFPEVQPATVRFLGEGYDSTAFEVGGEWVFRFPKRDEVERQLIVEMRLLPLLDDRSLLPVPEVRFRGAPSEEFPRSFGGYSMIPGEPAITFTTAEVPLDAWAPVLGRWLSWLHAVPTAEAVRLGVGMQEIGERIDEARAEALEEFHHLRQVTSDRLLERWHAYLVDGPGPEAGASSPVLVHGDLAAEHVLCDRQTGEINGIIDWTEIHLGDRSVDLAGLFHWGGGPFVDAALKAYDGPVDDTTLRRARFLAACRGVADIAFGLETARREYIRAGIRALTLCAHGGRP